MADAPSPTAPMAATDIFLLILSFSGAFALVSYLFVLLLKRRLNRRRIKTKFKETLLGKDLPIGVKSLIAGDEGDESLKARVSGEDDFIEMLSSDAEECSSNLHERCRKLSIVLANERGLLSFLIPRWKWNTREYMMFLLTGMKKYSEVADEQSATDGSRFCVPVSRTYIREKILVRSTSDPRLEGIQLSAKICKDAGFEGAQLAMVCKAVQLMQKGLERRWKMSLRIIMFTVANFLTIYAFWYTETNTIQFILAFSAGDLIGALSIEAIIKWLIPKLDEDMENVVLIRKLRLENDVQTDALTDASQHKLLHDKKEDLHVTEWVSSYFKKFEEVKELLQIRDRAL